MEGASLQIYPPSRAPQDGPALRPSPFVFVFVFVSLSLPPDHHSTPPLHHPLAPPAPTPSPPISFGQLASPPGRPSPPPRRRLPHRPRRDIAPPVSPSLPASPAPGHAPGPGTPTTPRRSPSPGWGAFLTNPPAPLGPESCLQALAGPDHGEGAGPPGASRGAHLTLPTGERTAPGGSANSSAPLPACQLATGPGRALALPLQAPRAPPGLVTGRETNKGQRPPQSSVNWRVALGGGTRPGGLAAASGCKRPGARQEGSPPSPRRCRGP